MCIQNRPHPSISLCQLILADCRETLAEIRWVKSKAGVTYSLGYQLKKLMT